MTAKPTLEGRAGGLVRQFGQLGAIVVAVEPARWEIQMGMEAALARWLHRAECIARIVPMDAHGHGHRKPCGDAFGHVARHRCRRLVVETKRDGYAVIARHLRILAALSCLGAVPAFRRVGRPYRGAFGRNGEGRDDFTTTPPPGVGVARAGARVEQRQAQPIRRARNRRMSAAAVVGFDVWAGVWRHVVAFSGSRGIVPARRVRQNTKTRSASLALRRSFENLPSLRVRSGLPTSQRQKQKNASGLDRSPHCAKTDGHEPPHTPAADCPRTGAA